MNRQKALEIRQLHHKKVKLQRSIYKKRGKLLDRGYDLSSVETSDMKNEKDLEIFCNYRNALNELTKIMSLIELLSEE